MTAGEKIKALRENLGYTQEELGKKCGTTKQTIQKYENGTVTNIPLDRIEMLAVHLQTTPEHIVGWERQEKIEAEAHLHAKVLKDSDLMELIKDYYSLDESHRALIRNFVHDIAHIPGIGQKEE